MRVWGLIVCLFALVSAAPADTPAQMVFKEWLAAFNSGDPARIKDFWGRRLEDPDAMFALDLRDNSGGFDVVKIERSTPLEMSVLLRERDFPELQRLTFKLEGAGKPGLETFDFKAFALPGNGAVDATAAIATKLDAQDKFAGAIVAATGDKITLAKTWGQADKQAKTPLTLDTPMFLASAGKMFTGVAILQLVDAGKIALDDPLGKFLPDYPNKEVATRVTIRMLLSHRGGTGDIGILGRDEAANRAKVRSIADIIALNGQRGPEFAPGSKFEYSNYGFILLGAVIEKVSGQSYTAYIADHVFKPAGMIASGYPDRNHLNGVAIGYTHYFGEEKALVSNLDSLPWQGGPAGGGVASANDMLHFFQAMKAGKLLSPAMFKLATTQQTPNYGFGFVVDSNVHSHWGHGGDAYGSSLALSYYPENDTIFLCMATREFVCNSLYFTWHYRVFGLTK